MGAPDREPVTVTVDDVTVRKTLNLEDFDAIAIVYEVSSNREDDTRFHIEDNVPEGVSTEDLGFHPEHEAAESTLSAESVILEDQLARGESSRIVLGIRNYPEDDLEGLTDEPTLELLGTDAPAPGSVSSGEATDPERAEEGPSSGGVVRVLANELRRDDMSDEARRQLRDEFLDTESELENQIAELEEWIDDFEVYQPPMEEFLSEYGTVERIRSAFRDEISIIEEAVTTVQGRTDEVVGGLDTVNDRIVSTGADLETAAARMDTVEEGLKSIKDEIGKIDNRIEDSEDQAEQVSDEVRALEQRAGNLEGTVADFEEELKSIRASIRDDIRDIESDIDEFESFRDRLSAAFGDEEGSFDIESDDG